MTDVLIGTSIEEIATVVSEQKELEYRDELLLLAISRVLDCQDCDATIKIKNGQPNALLKVEFFRLRHRLPGEKSELYLGFGKYMSSNSRYLNLESKVWHTWTGKTPTVDTKTSYFFVEVQHNYTALG